jgi:hypothetical protein
MKLGFQFAMLLLFVAAMAPPPLGAEAPKLEGYVLGAPGPAPAVVSAAADGAITVNGSGRDSWGGRDEGAFAGFQTPATNFTFIARIAKVPAEMRNARFGITLREGLKGYERAVHARYDAAEIHRCAEWFARHLIAMDTHCEWSRAFKVGIDKRFDKPEGLWLKLVRRYPYVDMYVSPDGKAWEQFPYKAVLMAAKLWVGLEVTAGPAASLPVTFDNISFADDSAAADASKETPANFKEYAPMQPCTMYFATVLEKSPPSEGHRTGFILIPDSMDRKAIRAVFWTPGQKETLMADGSTFSFAGAKVDPKDMLRLPPQWVNADGSIKQAEGAYKSDRFTDDTSLLAHYGIVRAGGPVFDYLATMEALGKVAGIPWLRNLPFMTTGMSAAGSGALWAGERLPDRAVCLTHSLGGFNLPKPGDPLEWIPYLHLYGSKDSGSSHFSTAKGLMGEARQRRLPSANAPVWLAQHRPCRDSSLLFPFFVDCTELRVPAGHDFSAGPAKLNRLKDEDGWLCVADSWIDPQPSNYPPVFPAKGYRGDAKLVCWMPTERLARTWQAFVSFNPFTVLCFPAFDGGAIGHAQPPEMHNSSLPAAEPFEIVASGRIAKDLKIEFYADTKPLEVLPRSDGNPFRASAAGLPPGLHVLYAVTTIGDIKEISRPVTIMFYARK